MAALLFGGEGPVDDRELVAALAELAWALVEELAAERGQSPEEVLGRCALEDG
jgi:hypothetical protein